jgi:hypothetical protein
VYPQDSRFRIIVIGVCSFEGFGRIQRPPISLPRQGGLRPVAAPN